MSQVSYNGTAAFTYRYDSAGNVTEMTDISTGVTYYYTSDLIGRPTVMRTSHGQALEVSYDEKNRTDAIISEVKGVTTETGFTYGDGSTGRPQAAITAVSIDGTDQVTYTYDNLGRLFSKLTGAGSTAEQTVYSYMEGAGEGTTSILVKSVAEDGVTTSYTYDSLGNIKTISVDGDLVKSYEYDALGQLVRENDREQNVTITYTYNAGGNLTWKKTYEYTEDEPGETIEVLPFSYSNDWRDMLITYKGRTITYDAIGNPLTYRDGMSLEWIRGRRLGTLTVGDTTASYTYDDNGIRTSKTVNGVKTTYYLNGSTILTQICGETRLDFLYDEQGSVIGFKYNDGIYLYKKNLQGDIIGIRNSAGTLIAEYSYDAWGKVLSVTGTEADTIGILNPIRYRGYYYDEESGLYYLNSRYYDAETGRFVNADSVIDEGAGVLGNNIYIYAANNPINNSDYTGQWIIKDAIKWVSKNVYRPIVKITQKTFSSMKRTYSIGVNVSFTPTIFSLNYQQGVSIDAKGNVALQSAFSGGVTVADSPSISASVYQTSTNAPSIDKLDGLGYQIGGSVGTLVNGVPLAVGGDLNIIPDTVKNDTYLGVTTNIGLGVPGAEFHIEWGKTSTWKGTQFNIFDVVEEIYIKIMEW